MCTKKHLPRSTQRHVHRQKAAEHTFASVSIHGYQRCTMPDHMRTGTSNVGTHASSSATCQDFSCPRCEVAVGATSPCFSRYSLMTACSILRRPSISISRGHAKLIRTYPSPRKPFPSVSPTPARSNSKAGLFQLNEHQIRDTG